MRMRRRRECRHGRPGSGFTLLELLVVVLIIGLLTGIVGPRFMAQIGRSEATTAKAQMVNRRNTVSLCKSSLIAQSLEGVAPGADVRAAPPTSRGEACRRSKCSPTRPTNMAAAMATMMLSLKGRS